ncbi:DUF2345 domain-containing protein, partial [uncultured Moraxella sp.]|uniref:DUF2345 domain-containing protein n=1 Tax=uncultured Moraxella sp. TaxID=263769 RepID=UPI0025D3219E
RSDGHGVLRADKGMVISTQGRAQAAEHIKSIQEPTHLLETAYHQHHNLANSAKEHQAQDDDDQLGVAKQLLQQATDIKGGGNTQELASPQLLLHSPVGIEVTSNKSVHVVSQEHTAITSAQHTSISSGKNLLATVRGAIRFFAQLAGIRLFAAKGKVEINAQTDDIDVLALNKIKIHSNNDWVEITAPKGILINAGGSYIKITKEGIEQGTNGQWTAQASSHTLSGPANIPLETESRLFNDEMFVLKDSDGNILANERYKIVTKSGEVFYGVTDNEGRTDRVFTGGLTEDLEVFLDDR